MQNTGLKYFCVRWCFDSDDVLHEESAVTARLRAQGSGNVCTPPNNSECPNAAMPRCDNPPTYESAMANYIDAKQQLRAMEEGAVAGAMAMTASTTTIETCVTDVESSRTDLRAPNVVEIAPTGSISVNLTSEETKPPLQ
ncbi:unnamed protein product [Ceratitis capitata]|uniref:(Mediterranean fruit fly) hypothetical protein n=1 Tax=Ceratitis capitata TaxID=7213 RepID=A0A811VG62_CERCA|nr:unnamed protein product [Ceratitis capitata]